MFRLILIACLAQLALAQADLKDLDGPNICKRRETYVFSAE